MKKMKLVDLQFIKIQNNIKINDQSSSTWLENEINELEKLDNLEIKTRTSVAAYHGYNYLLARENLTDHLVTKHEKQNQSKTKIIKD